MGMGKAFTQSIERRQQRLKVRDRQMRWIWIGLVALAMVAAAMLWLRGDPATRPVDVNVASLEQLQTLPDVGPEIAERITAGRPYSEPDDLLKVKGIGPKTLEAMRPRLVFQKDHAAVSE